MDEVREPSRTPAVRLIFEYDGDDVRLISQQPVDVAVPGFDIGTVAHPGHYVEMRDDASRTLSRVPVRGAFEDSAEVFPEQPGEPIVRVDAPRRGAFTVVVPAGRGARQAALVEVRAAAPAEPGAPRAE